MNEFLAKLAEIIDEKVVKDNDVLADFPAWDSLSVLSTIALVDSKYHVNLRAPDFKEVRTAGDLWNLVQSRQQR